jgi:hypothetical protein
MQQPGQMMTLKRASSRRKLLCLSKQATTTILMRDEYTMLHVEDVQMIYEKEEEEGALIVGATILVPVPAPALPMTTIAEGMID